MLRPGASPDPGWVLAPSGELRAPPGPVREDGEPAGHGPAASPDPADPAGPCWGANIHRARGRSVEGQPRRCAGWGRGARVWPCSAGVGPVRGTSWGSAPLAPVAPPMELRGWVATEIQRNAFPPGFFPKPTLQSRGAPPVLTPPPAPRPSRRAAAGGGQQDQEIRAQ